MFRHSMLDEHVVAVVLENLDTRDCCTASRVCRAWRRAAQAEYLWQGHLTRDWCHRTVVDPAGPTSAAAQWHAMFDSHGRYLPVYRDAWQWWDTVLAFFRERLPAAAASACGGASDAALDRAEAQLGVKLCVAPNVQANLAPPDRRDPRCSPYPSLFSSPDFLRCIYRIHDGQLPEFERRHGGLLRAVGATQGEVELQPSLFHGLLGGCSVYDNCSSVRLLPVQEAVAWTESLRLRREHFGRNRALVIVGLSFNISKMLVVDTSRPHAPALWGTRGLADTAPACPRAARPQDAGLQAWMRSFAHNLRSSSLRVAPMLPTVPESAGLVLFPRGGPLVCAAVTRGVLVEVATLLLPEQCAGAEAFWAYEIRFTLLADHGQPWSSCQLKSRHWRVQTPDGQVDTVHGAAVVGRLPLLLPSARTREQVWRELGVAEAGWQAAGPGLGCSASPPVAAAAASPAHAAAAPMPVSLSAAVSSVALADAARQARHMSAEMRAQGEDCPAEEGVGTFEYRSCTHSRPGGRMGGGFLFVPGSYVAASLARAGARLTAASAPPDLASLAAAAPGSEFWVACPTFPLELPEHVF